MFIVIFITTKSAMEANKIAKKLLEERLIACANIVNGVRSLFWWDSKVNKTLEYLLVIKSKKSQFKKIVETVKKYHSYSVPEIIALPIIEGNDDYLNWIDETVRN